MSEPLTPDEQALLDRWPSTPLVSGPRSNIWDTETGRRVRRDGNRITGPEQRRAERGILLAEVECRAVPQRPARLMRVLGSKAALHLAIVESVDGESGSLDSEFLVSCRCGLDHVIVGAQLRRAIGDALQARRASNARPPKVDAVDVSRTE